MDRKPLNPEIDHHTAKFIVGFIALSLASLTDLLTPGVSISSISLSYHLTDTARNVFVGALCVISAFLWSYNGYSLFQAVLSKVAAVAVAVVAFFPCDCFAGRGVEGAAAEFTMVGVVHTTAAISMFIILAIFCWLFYLRAKGKGSKEAKVRGLIYRACAVVMLGAMAAQLLDILGWVDFRGIAHRLTYYVEATGLMAFGIAWLTASRMLPFVTNEDERIKIALSGG
ncbi:DUF998 domain-containing protein [Microbulbifer agarilyticus]|uniref:DUF998 domain-containing protein n=1 Tax=Microbulbifer agarilyticus TaxID=260552 RepID=UPI001CD79D90|nr:DUF998 domain-containing protein [Microbulbifer agarilyticus]MCA0894820.1 DUF998 domain-containing protein [Microbulbifer agarilyticus]